MMIFSDVLDLVKKSECSDANRTDLILCSIWEKNKSFSDFCTSLPLYTWVLAEDVVPRIQEQEWNALLLMAINNRYNNFVNLLWVNNTFYAQSFSALPSSSSIIQAMSLPIPSEPLDRYIQHKLDGYTDKLSPEEYVALKEQIIAARATHTEEPDPVFIPSQKEKQAIHDLITEYKRNQATATQTRPEKDLNHTKHYKANSTKKNEKRILYSQRNIIKNTLGISHQSETSNYPKLTQEELEQIAAIKNNQLKSSSKRSFSHSEPPLYAEVRADNNNNNNNNNNSNKPENDLVDTKRRKSSALQANGLYSKPSMQTSIENTTETNKPSNNESYQPR